jgi:hypothetical protein
VAVTTVGAVVTLAAWLVGAVTGAGSGPGRRSRSSPRPATVVPRASASGAVSAQRRHAGFLAARCLPRVAFLAIWDP